MQKNFVINSDNFNVYYSRDSFHEAKQISDLMEMKLKDIYEFYEIKNDKKLQGEVYLFDSLHEMKKYLDDNNIYELEHQPSYMTSCERERKLYLLTPKDKIFDDYTKDDYDRIIYHEEIHLVTELVFGYLPEWLNEGIAKYLDGTYKKGMKSLFENYINNYRIPDLEQIDGDTFVTDDYDGYDLCYVLVSYIIDVNGKDKLLNLVNNKTLIERVSTKDLNLALDYYRNMI